MNRLPFISAFLVVACAPCVCIDVSAATAGGPSALLPAGGKGGAIRAEAEHSSSIFRNPERNEPVGVADGELDSGESVKLYRVGDSAQIQLSLPRAGSYRVTARVRAGGKEDPTGFWPEGYRFKLDGQPLVLIPDKESLSKLDPAYGGCYWGSMSSSELLLRGGTHVFEIAAHAAWAVADYVEATPTAGEASDESSGPVVVTLPAPLRIEAEDNFTVVADRGGNGKVSVADGQLDSGRSVCLYDAGDTARLPVTVRTAGVYRLDVRVRSGGDTGPTSFWPDGYLVTLDGEKLPTAGVVASVSDWDTAYGGCTWGTMQSSCVVLSAGRHQVDVAAQTDWAVLDYVELVAVQPLGTTDQPTPGKASAATKPAK